MPARRAMSSVDVPSRPRSANSTIAASSTASRRSVAESLVVAEVMTALLVITHKFVKRFRDPVEIPFSEPPMERQRERPLEDGVGAGERPLPAVGAQPVESVRADLALDSLRPQGGHHLVAAVELDHVGLPAVAVARVGRGEDDVEACEPLRVARGDPRAYR